MVYYHYINSFLLLRIKLLLYLTKKIKLLYLFLLFEIFEFEILDTNYGSPVIEVKKLTTEIFFENIYCKTLRLYTVISKIQHFLQLIQKIILCKIEHIKIK